MSVAVPNIWEQEPPSTGSRAAGRRRAVFSALIGSALEFYDFLLYATASAVVFGHVFFPAASPLIGTLASFLTYGIGFAARPLGGIVFGHLSDRRGRKAALIITMLLMGTATTAIGVLPGYSAIGYAAPVLLTCLRMLQGFGVGGESSSASVLVIEHVPENRRGIYGSMVALGAQTGLLAASGGFALVALMPEGDLLSWGWRIPFLASAVVVVIGLALRLRLDETPAFSALADRKEIAARPVITALRTQRPVILRVIGIRIAENGVYYIWASFLPIFLIQGKQFSDEQTLIGLLIAAAVTIATVPAAGWLSDRVGRRAVVGGGAIFSGLAAYPLFALANTGYAPLAWLASGTGLGVGVAAMFGPQPAFYSELFPAAVRSSASALGRETGTIFSGSIAPIVAILLFKADGDRPWLVAMLVVVMCAITTVSVFLRTASPRILPSPSAADRVAAAESRP